jgi:hypothetical protein
MGTWGTGISSNDTYGDVYADFFDLYNGGKEVDEITEIVTKRNQEMLEMPDAVNDFWFALAKAQWECKELQPEIYEQVKTIVESGDDLKVWAALGATKRDIEKRRKVLQKFLLLLQSERPKPKKRKKKVIREPIFKKGDCLTYKLANGNYGGALVLEAECGTELGRNLIAVTRINSATKPSVEEFREAEILIKNFAQWDGKPHIIWLSNYKANEVKELVEVTGSIDIEREFISSEEKLKYSYTSGWKMTLIDGVNCQFESEKTKPKPNVTLAIKKLIKKGFWERLTSIV